MFYVKYMMNDSRNCGPDTVRINSSQKVSNTEAKSVYGGYQWIYIS